MNKPICRQALSWAATLGLCLAQLGLLPPVLAANEAPVKLQSLRGSVDVTATSPESAGTRFGPDQPALPRDFVQQPPLVPHSVAGYNVTKNFNKCLDCHAWSRAKESGATKISITHFKTRDGTELSSVSPQRYFCDQCHVPQSDAAPLVGNTFKPGVGLR